MEAIYLCEALSAPTAGTPRTFNTAGPMTISQLGDLDGCEAMVQMQAYIGGGGVGAWLDVLSSNLTDEGEVRNLLIPYGCNLRVVVTGGGTPVGYRIVGMPLNISL